MATYAPLGGIPNVVQGQEQLNQNALAEYTRAQQEKQQTALLQQQTQGAALDVQQKQIAVQDQQAGLAAMKDPDFKSMNDLPNLIQKHGGSLNAIMGARNSVLDYNTKLQTYTSDELKNQATKNDAIAGHIDTIKGLPPEQQPAAFENAKTDLVQNGYMTPQEAQQTAYPGPDGLDALEKMHMAHSAQVEQQLKTQQGNEAAAKARMDTATAAHQEFINNLTANSKPGDFDKQVDAILPPNGASSGGQNMYTKAMVNGALSRGDLPGAQKIMDDAFQNVNSLNKDVSLATNPQVQQGKVNVAAAEGKARMQAQLALLSPEAREMAAQYYAQTGAMPAGMRSPGMSAGILNTAAAAPGGAPNVAQNKMTYGAETALQKSAIAGPIGQQVTAYNTAIAHANQLREAATALDNGDVRALNAIGNKIGFEFGSDKTTNFNVIKNALAGEVSKVFKGGEASDAEIKAVSEPFSTANSPAQLNGAIDNAVHLMNSKREALQQQYQQGMQGKPNFQGAAPPAAAGTDFFGQFGGKARPQ